MKAFIPEPLIKSFLFELKMYSEHLKWILGRIKGLDDTIRDEYEKIQNNYNPEQTDEGEVFAQAADNVLGGSTFPPHFQRSGAISGYCILIYHLMERFLEDVSAIISHSTCLTNSFPKFMEVYPDFKKESFYPKLDELRLLCNVCKHGKGSAEKKLREKRPNYFREIYYFHIAPLSGYDLIIDFVDFEEYLEAIKQFTEKLKKEWAW